MLEVLPESLEEALLEIIREEGVEDRVHGRVGVAQAVRQQDYLVYILYYIYSNSGVYIGKSYTPLHLFGN
jgi:hypothetical protein